MKFKVGDKVRGISNIYNITNKYMYLGEIKEVGDEYIDILILKHKNLDKIRKVYTAWFPEGKFEIVKSKNGKFFKSLPNDFTGTLEVKNGYIVEKEILDDTEKEYLNTIIRPFRNKVECIKKVISYNEDKEYISIIIKDEPPVDLPYFESNTMYEGMKIYKNYTLEELGL